MALLDTPAVRGRVVTRSDDAYDAARQAWNLTADQRPAAVVFAEDAADVAAAVRYAAKRGLKVAAQGTGHGAALLPALPDTILLKTLRMAGVEVEGRTARVEAGAVWGDLAVAAAAHGLTGLSGSSPTVGVTGYTLGGGMGWLARRFGFACNTVTAIELVLADGEQVRATADREPELFWALRGGGGGFGVVTALELALEPLPRVCAGTVSFAAEDATAVFAAYGELVADAPDELTSGIRFLAPPGAAATVDVTYATLGADPLLALRKAARPLRDTVAEGGPDRLCRIAEDPEPPTPCLTDGFVLDGLPAEALIDVAGPGSPLLMVALRQLGGELARSRPDAGVLDRLDGAFALHAVGLPLGPEVPAHLTALRAALEPWTAAADYRNFAGVAGEAAAMHDPVAYDRLRAMRRKLDPTGTFVSIHPVT